MTDLVWTLAEDDDPAPAVTVGAQHDTLTGRSVAGAHPATAITYDGTASALDATTVQAAIDELAADSGGGGAVASVNGETGTVVLDAADVGAVPITAVGLLAGETNRGVWSALTAYVPGDVVHDHAAGGLYVCTVASTNEQPSLTAAKWTEIDGTGRQIALAPGSSAVGALGAAFGPGAEGGGTASTAVGCLASAAGDYATATGFSASAAGFVSTAVGGQANAAGDFSTAVGPFTSTTTDGEVNIANIYRGSVDPGDPSAPTGATIATGFVDLPETADATNPAADHQRIVARTDGLYVRDETGAEIGPLGAGGGGIPETIIDAAGDLIIGTAADTAARLAVGTSGQVLTSNGTTAAWAAPGGGLMQSIGYTSGGIYGLVGAAGSVNYHLAAAAGRWVAHPIWLPAGNYSGLSVLSTAAAVATWRLGIYNGTPDGATTLLHDCGTVAMNATPGSLLASSAFTVPTTGLYWVAVLVDAHTATPTVWSHRDSVVDSPALPYLGARLVSATAVRSPFARYASSVSVGSMPGTAPTQLLTDQPPLIRAHAA